MKRIPETTNTVVVRTDFSDDVAWKEIRASVREISPEDQVIFAEWVAINEAMGQDVGNSLRVFVDFIDDPEHAGVTADELLKLVPDGSNKRLLFVVDGLTVAQADHPILVVDLLEERGRRFRAVPAQIAAIEGNLSFANMDWEEFADNVAADGVFRGFPRRSAN
jgi:hypothetical protein